MADTVTIKASKGLRNNTSGERMEAGDLTSAVNVDLDSTGRISRRSGRTLILAGDMHSLWSNGQDCYVVIAQVLYRVLPDLSLQELNFNFVGKSVTYASLGPTTYLSDNFRTASVRSDGRVRAWGMAAPDTPPATVTTGDLAAGTYQYAMTFVRDDGHESGASRARVTTLTAAGGLLWPLLPSHGDAVKVRIYLSQANSELLYHAGDFQPEGVNVAIRGILHRGVRLRTQFMDAPPPGMVFGPWMGRIFIASGQFVAYTTPFEYELISPRDNWWVFPEPVQTMAFVSDGVYVGTKTKTYWLQGGDPTSVSLVEKYSYGTVRGTERVARPDLVGENAQGATAVYWASQKGICIGFPGGQTLNLTGERYEIEEALFGAGVLIDNNQLPQYRVTLFDDTPASELFDGDSPDIGAPTFGG